MSVLWSCDESWHLINDITVNGVQLTHYSSIKKEHHFEHLPVLIKLTQTNPSTNKHVCTV